MAPLYNIHKRLLCFRSASAGILKKNPRLQKQAKDTVLWEGCIQMFSIKQFVAKAYPVSGYGSRLIQVWPLFSFTGQEGLSVYLIKHHTFHVVFQRQGIKAQVLISSYNMCFHTVDPNPVVLTQLLLICSSCKLSLKPLGICLSKNRLRTSAFGLWVEQQEKGNISEIS